MASKHLSWSSARKICIVKILAELGHYPTRKTEKEALFLSPLRSETQASFSVSLSKNLWFDFGLGKGGNTIDLIMAMNNCSAFNAIQSLQGKNYFSFSPEKVVQESNRHKIKKVKPINHPALKGYLQSRNIPLKVGQTYCHEIWHEWNDKPYFSLGLKNDAGGWELRNKYHKSSTSPKTITSIARGCPRLLIVEGMFDLLSLEVLDEQLTISSDLMVLNSLGNIEKIKGSFKAYPEVFLYLDNDKAGKAAAKNLLSRFKHFTDRSVSFRNFKDLNEKLQHNND